MITCSYAAIWRVINLDSDSFFISSYNVKLTIPFILATKIEYAQGFKILCTNNHIMNCTK